MPNITKLRSNRTHYTFCFNPEPDCKIHSQQGGGQHSMYPRSFSSPVLRTSAIVRALSSSVSCYDTRKASSRQGHLVAELPWWEHIWASLLKMREAPASPRTSDFYWGVSQAEEQAFILLLIHATSLSWTSHEGKGAADSTPHCVGQDEARVGAASIFSARVGLGTPSRHSVNASFSPSGLDLTYSDAPALSLSWL